MSVLTTIVRGFIALVLLVYLAINGVGLVQAHQRRGEISELLSAELESAFPAAVNRQEETVSTADREPDERWIEQHCDFSTNDAGWIPQSYRQVCSIRNVAA